VDSGCGGVVCGWVVVVEWTHEGARDEAVVGATRRDESGESERGRRRPNEPSSNESSRASGFGKQISV
jgi:hypothetical protein